MTHFNVNNTNKCRPYYFCIDIIIKLIIVAWSGVSGVGSAVVLGWIGGIHTSNTLIRVYATDRRTMYQFLDPHHKGKFIC